MFNGPLPEDPVNAGPTNAEPPCDSSWPELLLVPELADDRWIDFRFPSLVDAARLRCGDPLGLALLPQVGLELREYSQHIEEGLAGSGAGVDRLLSCAQCHSLFLQLLNDVLQIPSVSGRAGRSA